MANKFTTKQKLQEQAQASETANVFKFINKEAPSC